MKLLRSAGFAALVMITPAMADGDAALGEKVFNKCKTCHENEKGVNRVGPSLRGVVGRKTASFEGYKYSEAMMKKGAEGQVWDEPTLTTYLTNPKALVPGTKMSFPGLQKPEDIANVIAFLKAHP